MFSTLSKASPFFRQLRYVQVNSSMARTALSLFYRDNSLHTIPFGFLKGMRIRYDRHVNFHAVLGFWELEHFSFLDRFLFKNEKLRPTVIADLGANLGLYSLWFSQKVGANGKIYSFEPAPYCLEKLQEHVQLNGAKNIETVAKACSDRIGTTEFFIGFHHHTSSLVKSWAGGGQVVPQAIEVPTTTLDAYFFEGESKSIPDLIKIDIEGGAAFALRGCHRLCSEKRPFVFIESHTPAEDKAIGELCLKYDYLAYRVNTREWVKNLSATHPVREGVWGNLFLCPEEKLMHLDLPRN